MPQFNLPRNKSQRASTEFANLSHPKSKNKKAARKSGKSRNYAKETFSIALRIVCFGNNWSCGAREGTAHHFFPPMMWQIQIKFNLNVNHSNSTENDQL
jgi:hypothetical protein